MTFTYKKYLWFSSAPSPTFGDVTRKEKNVSTFAYQHVPSAVEVFFNNILFISRQLIFIYKQRVLHVPTIFLRIFYAPKSTTISR